MNDCYAYSCGEAVQAIHASTYGLEPFELSTQQIVDYLPRKFDYVNCNKRKDKFDCYYNNHTDAFTYIMLEGLVKDENYVKRQSRKEKDILPIPNVTRYGIKGVEFVFQEGRPLNWKRSNEVVRTIEEINSILREQPMVGAVSVYKSFDKFKGEGIYMGPDADEVANIILHSILIVGFGRSNGVNYYKIKHQGFGKIRRELVSKLAYPFGPFEIKATPYKVAVSATKIKNTKRPRSKSHGSTSKTSQSKSSGQKQSGVQGIRYGTEAVRKRMHSTHDDIDDTNEANKRFKTNELWGIELKPGKPFSHDFEKEPEMLHVSQGRKPESIEDEWSDDVYEESDNSTEFDSDDPAYDILEGKPDGKIWKQYEKEWL